MSVCNHVGSNVHLTHEVGGAVETVAAGTGVVDVSETRQRLTTQNVTRRIADADEQVVVDVIRLEAGFVEINREVGKRFVRHG